ncbi:MAG: hypothetical protein IJX27_09820 [Clostridia bacterium]|nr:hypothetical protein [Clostridia bacterium]
MNFKKTFVLLWALVLTLALFSCGEASPLEIADENGEDDYSLAVLTGADICENEPRHFCKEFGIGIPEDANSIDESDELVACASTPFSGVTVLQKTRCEAEKVTFTVNCERAKGNMRLLLVDEKMNILHDFTVGENSVYELKGAKGKTYELRIAGESAEFTVTAERTFE